MRSKIEREQKIEKNRREVFRKKVNNDDNLLLLLLVGFKTDWCFP